VRPAPDAITSGTVPEVDTPSLRLATDSDADADVIGGWLQLPGSATAELMGSVGFGFVCVDQQHGLIGDDALLPMLQGIAATGTPSLVRVRTNEPATIGRALDRGAAGVIVPLVDSPEEADQAVAACHHPPRGSRSYGPTRVSWHGDRPDPLCIVMIETTVAVAALPRILEVDDLDGIFIGPSDLALSSGMPLRAQDGDPAYDDLLRSIVQPSRDRGLPVGIYCASPAHVHRFRELGCTFFALPSEATMLRGAAAEQLARSRRPQSAHSATV
jgi:4-hydroxy-2-oxoheptanedioate aldolase